MGTINYKDPSLLANLAANGVMSSADKNKLNGLTSGMQEILIALDGYGVPQSLDGYATLIDLQGETNRSLAVEQEIKNVLDGYSTTTYVDGYVVSYACSTTDPRLSNSRTPTAHAATHIAGGEDSIDGYHVHLDYTPRHYPIPVDGYIGEHIANIDAKLSSGDLYGTLTTETVVGITNLQIVQSYKSGEFDFAAASGIIAVDGYLWVSFRDRPIVLKIDPANFNEPLKVILTQTSEVGLYIESFRVCGNYLIGRSPENNTWEGGTTVAIIDLTTEELVAWVPASDACVDSLGNLWCVSNVVSYAPLAEAIIAFPNGFYKGIQVPVSTPANFWNQIEIGPDGYVWFASFRDIGRVDPTTLEVTVNNSVPWNYLGSMRTFEGILWVLGFQWNYSLNSKAQTVLYAFTADSGPNANTGSVTICDNDGTRTDFGTDLTASSSYVYVTDTWERVHLVSIPSLTYSSFASRDGYGTLNASFNHTTILENTVWVSVSDAPVSSEHGFSSFEIGTLVVSSPNTGNTGVQISTLDEGARPVFPASVKIGEVLTSFPESSAFQIVPISNYNFVVLRKISAVLFDADPMSPGKYQETIFSINESGLSLNLDNVTLLRGVYDESRYVWVLSDYLANGVLSRHLWKIDTTFKVLTSITTFDSTSPVSTRAFKGLQYAYGGLYLLSTDLTSGLNYISRYNESTQTFDPYTLQVPNTTFDTNVNQSSGDFLYISERGLVESVYYGKMLRYNPSNYTHRVSDTVNIISSPDATEIVSAMVLLNELKDKLTLHFTQLEVHLLDDRVNAITATDAADNATAAALANQIKLFFAYHCNTMEIQHGGVGCYNYHYFMDGLAFIATADAVESDENSIVALANACKASYEGHRTRGKVILHDYVDFTAASVSSNPLWDGSTPEEIAIRLNRLRDILNQHMLGVGIHSTDDIMNIIIGDAILDSPYAGPNYPNIYALSIELKAKFNSHLTQSGVHYTNDLVSALTTADPIDDTDLAGVILLANCLLGRNTQSKYESYLWHIMQGSNVIEYTYQELTGNLSTIAAIGIGSSKTAGYWSGSSFNTLIISSNNSASGVPYFINVNAEGYIGSLPFTYYNTSWNLGGLTDPPLWINDLEVDSSRERFWFTTGEGGSKYIHQSVFGTATPNPLISLTKKLPYDGVGLCGGDLGLLRIIYPSAGYVGDIDYLGSLDTLFKYPLGGALQFGPVNSLVGLPVEEVTDLAAKEGAVLTLSDGKLVFTNSGGEVLSNVRYVDGGGATTSRQIGSINQPYLDFETAITAVGSVSYPGPTLCVTPGDYTSSSELTWISASNSNLTIKGLGPLTNLPSINSSSHLYLDKVGVYGNVSSGGVSANQSHFEGPSITLSGENLELTHCTFGMGVGIYLGKITSTPFSYSEARNPSGPLMLRSSDTAPFTTITITGVTTLTQAAALVTAAAASIGISAEVQMVPATGYNNYYFILKTQTGYLEVAPLPSGSYANMSLGLPFMGQVFSGSSTVSMDHATLYSFRLRGGVFTGNIIITEVTPPPALTYLPLVSGTQPAGSTYTLIGAIPVLDYTALGAGSAVFRLNTLVQIPAGSTAQIRLYDKTNTTILFESSEVAGLETDYNFGPQIFTPPTGSAIIEFWLATPTITGGNASCLAAGISITAT